MKKNLFMVAAVALVAVVSCNKEEINNGSTADSVMPGDAVEFIAVADADSKTSLNGEETHWVSGDAISVNGYEFTTTDSGAEAKFRRTEAFEAAETYNAVYPSAAGSSFETITIPAVQKAVAGQFPTDENGVVAVVSVASSSTNTLEFKNVTSMLKFSVPVTASEITISSNSALAGIVSVSMTADGPAWEAVETVKEIIVTGSFVAGSEYYAVVLPGAKDGLTIKVDDYVVKASEKSVNFKRSKAMTAALPYNVYLHANTAKYDWTSDGARFATWIWPTGESGSWKDFVAEGHDGVYRLEIADTDNMMVFCRMDGASQTNDWDKVWNQTGDLIIPSSEYNHFYINGSSTGVWRNKDAKYFTKSGYLYLKPNSNWTSDGARFAAYFFGNGETWVSMTDPDADGIYEVQMPTTKTYPSVIFCRMNPSKTANNWDNKWNQTGDLTIGTNNLFTIASGTWDGSTTTWSSVTEFGL